MATFERITHEVKERKAAVKLARSVSDFANKAGADKETQDFLWDRYQSTVKACGTLEFILEQIGSAIIDLQRAAEWRSDGVYAPSILETQKLSHPGWSERALAALHQGMIDKATEQQNLAMAELSRLFTKAEPYLSS